MSLNFTEIFTKHSEDSKKTWEHDRSKTVGASEAFQCLRRTFFTKRGYEPDASFTQSYGATSRGSMIEAHYVVPAIRSQLSPDVEALWMGDDQVTLIDGHISATPDGLLKNLPKDALKAYGIDDIESDCVLLEIKSFDPRINLTEPKAVHAGQVQQQFGLVHEKTNHRPEYVILLYVNASWMDDIRVFIIKRDPAMYEVCKKRAAIVYTAKAPLDVPPEGKLKAGSECDYCPFQKQCNQTQVASVPTGEGESDFTPAEEKELRTLVTQSEDIAFRIGELELLKKTTSEKIKEFLRKHGKRFGKTSDGYSASYSVAKGRKSYDLERIVEDTGIDLADYEKTGEPSERLTVRVPKRS